MTSYSKEEFLKDLDGFCESKTADFCSDADCDECAFIVMSEKIKAEKEKVDKLKNALEFVDYQFRTSLGDSNDMRESIKLARKTLKEIGG